ncbi:MAG TPA: efflux RND transporter permease subunit, partial [Polyangiaceae bacterium]
MIARIIELSAKYRGFVIVFYAALIALALVVTKRMKLDAIPDLSDPQVIIFTEWKGQSPTIVEDQVTYPIAASLLAAPRVSAVRGYSMFGMSFIYVLFDEGTDVYWARSRVLEYINGIKSKLPASVAPELGPDATGIGWIFEYALRDKSGKHDLAELRSFQDFTLRYALESVPGVAQVATVGGYERQYQITLDPDKLRAFGLGVADVAAAVRNSNGEVGGRLLEMSGREYFVRGRGYLQSLDELASVTLRAAPGGTPIRVGDVG